MADVGWVTEADDAFRAGVHSLVAAVAAAGGAVGWLEVPSRDESDAWLDGVLTAVAAGDAGLVVARDAGVVVALGSWRREPGAVFRQNAQLQKIMALPSARGGGLARAIVGTLLEALRDSGFELVLLGARGNNHGALALYRSFGFQVWGVVPDAIAVGDLRFDDVRMVLQLPRPDGVELRGSRTGGPGATRRRLR